MTHGALLADEIDFINDPTLKMMSTKGAPWRGAPQPRVSTLPSQVLDGSIVIHDSDDNRTMTFVVAWGLKPSKESRASAAKRVELQLGKRSTFKYSPQNGEPTALYKVEDSSWENISSDTDEALNRCFWQVTLTCRPYAFSTTRDTVSALVGTGVGDTVMDAGTSVTGWTSAFGTITTTGSVLRLPINGSCHINATKTFTATNFATTPFLRMDLQLPPDVDLNTIDVGVFNLLNAIGDSVLGKYVGATPAAVAGYTTLWFYFATTLTNATTFFFDMAWVGSGSGTMGLDNLTRSGSAPYLPGAQTATSLRNFLMKGSKRSEGSIAIDLQGASGVPWLAYTGPNLGFGAAYNPQILTTFASVSSGSPKVISGVPVAGLKRGGYIVVADIFDSGGPQSLTWTATQTGAPSQSGAQTFDFVGRGMVNLGPVDLPLGDVNSTSSATMTFTFNATSGSTFTLEAVFLLYMGPGAAVTMQDASTGRYVFINSPTIERPWAQVLSGSLADGSNAISQLGVLSSVMRHNFTPPVQMALIYAGGATAPTATLSYDPAYGDHPDS